MIRTVALGVTAALLLVVGVTAASTAPAALLPTPTPSFSLSASVAPTTVPHIDVPGEQPLTGSNYIFYGPDGSQYRHYEQTSLVLAASPTPTPTPSPTPTPVPVVTKFDDPAFTYFGTWGVYTGTEKYGGSDHFSADVTASYGFLFTGTAVTLYTQTAYWMGIVAVSVDGGAPVEFDAYAATPTQGVAFFRSAPLAAGVHRVIVHHTGRWNAAASEHQMTVDGADVTDGAIIAPLVP